MTLKLRIGLVLMFITTIFTFGMAVKLNSTSFAYAQSNSWSHPEIFFEVEFGGNVQTPVMVTDSGGNLHAFWSAAMSENESMILYYNRWGNDAWTAPSDILISPDGANTWPHEVIIDDDDFVHVFWVGQSGQRIWHYRSHASHLEMPETWTQLPIIVPEEVVFGPLDLTIGIDGVWHLVYGNRNLDQVVHLVSPDSGQQWVRRDLVYLEANPDSWVGYPGIVALPDGKIVVWWQQMEEGSGISTGLKYSVQNQSEGNWSEPQLFADGYYFGGFSVQGEVIVKYYGGGIGTGGRFVSFSEDNGDSWTPFQNISAGLGEGAQDIPIVSDSEGNIHFVVETSSNFARVESNGRFWGKPEFVVSPAVMDQCCITPGSVTENTTAAISDGNLMHVMFEQNNRVIWYTNRELPSLSVKAVPIASIGQDSESIPTNTPFQVNLTLASTPSPEITVELEDYRGTTGKSSILPIILPTIFVGVLLITVFIWRSTRRIRD